MSLRYFDYYQQLEKKLRIEEPLLLLQQTLYFTVCQLIR